MQYIEYDDYKTLVDFEYNFEGTLPPDKSVVHCSTPRIKGFFELIKNTNRQYILISSGNDAGLTLQNLEPSHLDIQKGLSLFWPDKEDGYKYLRFGPRVNLDKCDINDKYSIKMWGYTIATFDEIPKNILKWYIVNPHIEEDKVLGIPLGLNLGSSKVIEKIRNEDIKKEKLLYINFQNYNKTRVETKEFLKRNKQHYPWITFREEPNLPFEDYLIEIASHKYVLCPEGNGLDSHRVWESLYLGSVPITRHYILWEKYLGDLPILRTDSWHLLDEKMLENLWSRIKRSEDTYQKADLNYWANKIQQDKEELF